MWKYIVLVAVALFIGAAFFFYKNNEAMTSPEGEVVAVQTQFRNAVNKSREIELDKAIQKYAELRTAYFREQAADFQAKTEAAKAETEQLEQECMQLTTQLEAIKAAQKAASEAFNKFKSEALAAVELDSTDIADEEDFRVSVITKLANGADANQETSDKIASEDAITADLLAQIKDTNDKIAAAKKLIADRMARLSPPELKCSVQSVDPEWGFIVLDAGINKGIVSGSHLNVARGGKQIGVLNVTSVEANRATCEVVRGSMRPGDRVQPGDTVTSNRDNK